jgi:betaine-aldehyde dehydrogenase
MNKVLFQGTRKALNWIGASRVADGPMEPSINPATYEQIGSYPANGLAPAKAAIAAALKAFRESAWRHDVELRSRVLSRMADAYERNRERLIEQSGLGRLNGLAALDGFSEYKHIALRPGRL